MAKQKRKAALSPFVEQMKEQLVKIAVNTAVFLIFIVVVVLLAQAFLYRSDYFRVEAVEIKNSPLDSATISFVNVQILNAYKGKNIFTINLKGVASYLYGRFPDAKEATVRIALPDKIVANMKFRRAVALVRGAKYYPVDDDGVVLLNANEALFKFLPVVDGVEMRPSERSAVRGAPYRNLKVALELLREVKRSKFMAGYGLIALNAADAKSLSFTMKNGVQVKIGFENFKARLEMLRKVLKDPRMVMDRIEYIDVRFKDAVIGPREA